MMLNWECGRQGNGYKKMRLININWPIKFDLYLLKFPINSFVPLHTDPVIKGKHYRLNITLNPSISASQMIEGRWIYSNRYIKLFRPDLYEHGLTKVLDNTIYMISIGWIKKW